MHLIGAIVALACLISSSNAYSLKSVSTDHRMTSLKGFSDPNWNWGSSVGTGHDAAMKLRLTLGTSDKRRDFITNILGETVDIEDIKLAMALRFQRASREGIAGGDDGYKIMDKMARRKYENKDGETALMNDLRDLVEVLPVDLVLEAGPLPAGGVTVKYVAAQVLCGMKFCTVGI